MPIVDAHVHVMSRFAAMAPFDDLGRVDRLLHLMDGAGVDQAVMAPVVAPASPENNMECARWSRQHPDRLVNLVYVPLHEPGAADRIAQIPERYGGAGVSYYPPGGDITWMLAEPAEAVWAAMAAAKQSCNIQLTPPGYATVIELARRYPQVPFLCNHLGLPGRFFEPDEPHYGGLSAARELANIFVKASGFYAAADTPWDIRCERALAYLLALIKAVGVDRVLWGSDWPPVGQYLTYRQSVEIVRSIAPLNAGDRDLVLGANAARVFAR